MGKTHRIDSRDSDYESDPMDLMLYTHEDEGTTTDSSTNLEIIPGCERASIGNVYKCTSKSGIKTEVWITGKSEILGEFLALVTVYRMLGGIPIAARLISIPESFLDGMFLVDYQPISVIEPEVIEATG